MPTCFLYRGEFPFEDSSVEVEEYISIMKYFQVAAVHYVYFPSFIKSKAYILKEGTESTKKRRRKKKLHSKTVIRLLFQPTHWKETFSPILEHKFKVAGKSLTAGSDEGEDGEEDCRHDIDEKMLNPLIHS